MFVVIGFLESCSFALLVRVLSCGLFAESALSQKSSSVITDVIDVIGVIGVIEFCKGPPSFF